VDLRALRTVLSTGSPLLPEGFDYVYGAIKADLQLASISGGTDIVSCFALAVPRGRCIAARSSAADWVWRSTSSTDAGRPVRGERGELVCTAIPLRCRSGSGTIPPSQVPARLFERFPGVWYHGDYAALTEHDGVVIYGRSDAVLNRRRAHRTAEIYSAVESLPQILEALAVGQDWQGCTYRAVRAPAKRGRTRRSPAEADPHHPSARTPLPRHVPAKIIAVPISADSVRQGHRAGGAQRDPWAAGQEPGCTRQSRRSSRIFAICPTQS